MAGTIRGFRAMTAVGSATAFGLAFGWASIAVAGADPSVVTTPTPAPSVAVSGGVQAPDATTAPVSGDVLDQLAEQYAIGSGGGQLSNLLKTSLKLRAMGIKPSKANLAEITQAMTYRPNQIPLIDALKDTIAYQQKIKAQMEILQQYQKQQGANSAVMGAGQMPADSNPANLPGAGAPMMPPGAGAPMMPSAPTP